MWVPNANIPKVSYTPGVAVDFLAPWGMTCLVSTNGANVTMPNPVAAAGGEYTVKATPGVANVALLPSPAGELIDGYGAYGVPTGGSVKVVSDGANWWVLNVVGAAAPGFVQYSLPTDTPIPGGAGSVILITAGGTTPAGKSMIATLQVLFQNTGPADAQVDYWLQVPEGGIAGTSAWVPVGACVSSSYKVQTARANPVQYALAVITNANGVQARASSAVIGVGSATMLSIETQN
jgi:hypothetical protein